MKTCVTACPPTKMYFTKKHAEKQIHLLEKNKIVNTIFQIAIHAIQYTYICTLLDKQELDPMKNSIPKNTHIGLHLSFKTAQSKRSSKKSPNLVTLTVGQMS
jgi:hypothetical protein